VRAVREFALLSLLGILVAFVAAVTVTPALLLAFGRPRRFRAIGRAPLPPDRFARFAARTARRVVRHRKGVIAAFALVFVAALVVGSRVRVSTDSVHALLERSPARTDFDALNGALDGATSVRVIVDSAQSGGFAEPEKLAALAELERRIAADPAVGGTRSIAGWLGRLNGAVQGRGAPAAPLEDRALAAQLLLFGRSDEQAELVDPRWQRANLIVRTRASATNDLRSLRHRIESHIAALPAPMKARVTGQAVVFQRLWDDVIERQVQTVALSLAVVYAILSLLFLSPRAGLRALAPNVIPVACYFAVLGASGVPLNVATSFVAPMTLGFALNDTLHYFARFSVEARRLADEEAATVRSLVTVGRPMTYTTLAICAAFLVLVGSELENLRWVGATAAVTLALAWLCDFTLTPALCVGLRVVTLWDTLTLDLGIAPQRSIPLLQGLSTAQCRIVAQLASLRTVPGGQTLLRSGAEGREMFLVVDGLLEARIETPHGWEVLRRMGRGELVGEIGFYTHKHSAEVFVIEQARLLRLTEKTFERLNRRSPGIAAILYRNLSRIMAGRLADTTERIR
jgi:predicted RND superfamily exporter protein